MAETKTKNEMIEVDGERLEELVQFAYANSNVQGMGVLSAKEGDMPYEEAEKMVNFWRDRLYQKKEQNLEDARRFFKEIHEELDSSIDVEAKAKERHEQQFLRTMIPMVPMDYVHGRSVKLTIFIKFLCDDDKLRFFVNPSWLDHSDEQIEALKKEFGINTQG